MFQQVVGSRTRQSHVCKVSVNRITKVGLCHVLPCYQYGAQIYPQL